MSSDSSNLSSLARSKLHLSIGSKDNCSLHRWVLLKNSIIHSPSTTSSTSASAPELPCVNPVYAHDDVDDEDDDPDEVLDSVELDSFMFPDAGKLAGSQSADVKASEAQWLDSLLETLGDDDEEDYNVDSDIHVSTLPVEDDDDQFLSPMVSPMSSSDDLPNQHSYYPSPISVPYSYPVPYPPFHPPLIRSFDFDSHFGSSLSSLPAPYEDPLPYHYIDDAVDVDDLPVPDAIEDTSDDESDALSTPSFGRSSSSLPLVDAALVPLPAERSRLRHTSPQVYVDTDDSYFYPFELDPPPFPDSHHHPTYNPYQEC